MASPTSRTRVFPIVLLFHVRNKGWRASLRQNLGLLSAPMSPFAVGGEICKFVPVEAPTLAELAEYLTELIHGSGDESVVVISDQLCAEGVPRRLATVIRSACWSHGRTSTLISLDEGFVDAGLPFLAHQLFDGSEESVRSLRARIEQAGTRLHLMGAPDEQREGSCLESEYSVGPVADEETFSRCLVLRQSIYRHLEHLSPAQSNPGQLDVDYHDGMAIHFAAVHKKTGELAGTARVVLPNVTINDLRPLRARLRDTLGQQREYYRRVVERSVGGRAKRTLLDPGCAPLPMLKSVRPDDDWAELLEKAAGGAELSRFVVSPEYRGRGISRILAHMALATSLELERKHLFLQCFPNHAGMYMKYGFEEIQSRAAAVDGTRVEQLYDSMVCALDAPNKLTESLRWDAELFHLMNDNRDQVRCGLDHDCGHDHGNDYDLAGRLDAAEEAAAPSEEPASAEEEEIVCQDWPGAAHPYEAGQLFDRSVPGYFLDVNYRIQDWNLPFYRLFARPLGLRRGQHVTGFLPFFENCQESITRCMEVFAPGKNPLTDTEILLIRSERYGIISTRKLASQVFDARGEKIGWLVSFNITEWENRDIPLLAEMSDYVEEQLVEALLVQRSLYLLEEQPSYQEYEREIATRMSGARHWLELGLRSPKFVVRQLEENPELRITVHESSGILLEALRREVDSTLRSVVNRLRVIKAEYDFSGYPPGEFDGVSAHLRGNYDAARIARALARIVRDDGELMVVLPNRDIDHLALYSRLASERGQELDPLLSGWSGKLSQKARHEAALTGELAAVGVAIRAAETRCEDAICLLAGRVGESSREAAPSRDQAAGAAVVSIEEARAAQTAPVADAPVAPQPAPVTATNGRTRASTLADRYRTQRARGSRRH